MSEKRFHVIFTGALTPGIDKKSALSNLVLEVGLSEAKAKDLLGREQVLLKRCETEVEARRLAGRFQQAGLHCVVGERGEGDSANDSILMSIFTRFTRSDSKE